MSMREKIARAIEAADCHSVGFVDRATDAVLAILAEPGEEVVEAVARGLATKGFGRPWDDFLPCDAFDTGQSDLLEYARAAINAFLSEARKS